MKMQQIIYPESLFSSIFIHKHLNENIYESHHEIRDLKQTKPIYDTSCIRVIYGIISSMF